MPTIPLRLLTLTLTFLSLTLNLSLLSTAAHTLHLFNTHKHTSPYFLPIWSSHFETRQLATLIATSTIIVLLNSLFAVSLYLTSRLGDVVNVFLASVGLLLSLLALSYSSILQNNTGRDTLQTWTCTWKDIPNQSVPEQFETMCEETRFAFYATIPSFILQLLLLGLAVYGLFAARRASSGASSGGFGAKKEHELGGMAGQGRQDSWDEEERKERGSSELDGRERVRMGKE
ncbi:hypothetical protein TI39_contig290g00026 [Zymoseptoria brevis]|uniref:MARVEL domain-containing protein n=1 Tax=Zymoseptoria brevis TaxID=1047168 RepID=A0A0F4GVL9_9PEZI|nr:hypothetical protein TI39_contig290g00026 [Zymoseptoria brevis]